MERWNLKHVSVYATAILAVIIFSIILPALDVEQNLLDMYQKLLFAVPVLFILAAFLAFKISETGVFLIALSFLAMSLSGPLMPFLPSIEESGDGRILSAENWFTFFRALPFILSFTLSLIFLLPETIGKLPMLFPKIFISIVPLVFLFFPDSFESLLHIDKILWPGLVASFFPVAAPFLYRDRRSGTYSAALTAALILFMLPVNSPAESTLRESSSLFAGIILLHSLYRVYWENSYIDELTGLFNRRALDEKLGRLRRGYALAMVDVDHFKNFNDTYGHDEGDNVLRLVARILYTHFGTSAYRYGGEEFCVIFKKTDEISAAEGMDDARAAIAEHGFSIRQNPKSRKKSARKKNAEPVQKVQLTFSAGIAFPVKSTRDAAEVLKQADKALYVAKEDGRNRVHVFDINR